MRDPRVKREDHSMDTVVRRFDELATEQQPFAGGKGGTLARLHQANYPVPDGFVILPGASGSGS